VLDVQCGAPVVVLMVSPFSLEPQPPTNWPLRGRVVPRPQPKGVDQPNGQNLRSGNDAPAITVFGRRLTSV